MSLEGRRRCLEAARGDAPCDVVLRGRVVNVFSGEVVPTGVGICQGVIVGLGDYSGREVVDVGEAYLLPGLMDAHLHIESSMLSVGEFARAVVPHGTTAIVCDPHEVANVCGLEGIRALIEASRPLPLNVYFLAPSCVPASPFEDAGATLGPEEVKQVLAWERVLGLAEVMNYPGTVAGDEELWAKLQAAQGRIVDGHAPGLHGKALQAYLLSGPRSDHECTQPQEALEKLRSGMTLFLREGSASRTLDALLPVAKEHFGPQWAFACDDIQAEELLAEGHMDRILRRAVAQGLPPVQAVQMATLHPARYFRLWDEGALAPGYQANVAVVEDLKDFRVRAVYFRGRKVAEEGRALFALPEAAKSPLVPLRQPMQVRSLTREAFRLPPAQRVRVIEVIPHQIVTRCLLEQPTLEQGEIVADPRRDLLKAVAVERHRGSGRVGVGLVRGFGLQRGALATSVGHDAHNLTAVGASDDDLLRALERVVALGGGLVVVEKGEVRAELPLPLAGLMAEGDAAFVAERVRAVREAAAQLGCTLPDPFMTLSFLPLSVIPELRLTPRGLVDVNRFALVPLEA